MRIRILVLIFALLLLPTLHAANPQNAASKTERLSKAETALIKGNKKEKLMRVLTINDRQDSLLLRRTCTDFTKRNLKGKTAKILAEKMIATVTSPEQDGVGIAGPQVGISRRVVAVQRYDKPDKPFEVYFNIRCEPATDQKALGREGCLSVPNRHGKVMRYTAVKITYTDPKTLKPVTETISGFTAVIFQHETDHLDGILYIDRL